MHKPITQPVARSLLLSDNEQSRLTQRRPVAAAMLSSTSLARPLSSQSSSPLAHLTAALTLVPTLFGNRSARTYSPQRDERATATSLITIITFCCSRSSLPSFLPSLPLRVPILGGNELEQLGILNQWPANLGLPKPVG